ncbi:MAG: iron dicitrate transport regulator FecR [Alicyclobacillaceae bacterium]|nr:iron dicitrate transport regulator FecR [Alicyclobacillaceae bacterium]
MRAWMPLWQRARYPVVVSGAGISVASGLPTVGETWNGIPLRELFTRQYVERAPDKFYACYRDWLWSWRKADPNPAHLALASAGVPVITLNVDGLHRRAGSKPCIELHGRLFELRCRHCGFLLPGKKAFEREIPRCSTCDRVMHPNIVFVGEPVRHFAEAMDWVGGADLLLIIGTRLDTAPINQVPAAAHRKGIPVIRINRRAETLVPALLNKG